MDTRRPLRWLRAWAFQRIHGSARLTDGLDGTRAAVLMYHRVLPRAEARRLRVEPGMYVTPETFARHLEWLASDFRVLPLGEVVESITTARSLPRGACAITFDDGWKDNLDHALPALAARGLSATVFVVTGRVGTTGAFWPDEVSRRLSAVGPGRAGELARSLGSSSAADPLQAILTRLKTLPQAQLESALNELRERAPHAGFAERELLTWDELAALQNAGVSVESHAATHSILTALSPSAIERELGASREALVERGMGVCGLLAYPSGCSDPNVRAMAARAGYRAAFSTAHGLASSRSDPMELPRVGLHEDVSRTRPEFGFALATAAHEPTTGVGGAAA